MFRFSIRDINIKKKLKFILTYCYNFCVILFAIFFLKIVILQFEVHSIYLIKKKLINVKVNNNFLKNMISLHVIYVVS